MEVAYVSPQSLRLKSKIGTFALYARDPKEKTELDAILAFEHSPITDGTITFAGPGEYEVKGIKLTGLGKEQLFGYMGKIEGMSVCVTKASLLAHSKDMSECDVAIILCDTVVDTAQLANLSAKAIVVSGVESEKVAKDLDKESTATNKFVVTKDKLPAELQIVVLG